MKKVLASLLTLTLTLAGTAWLYVIAPKGFLPSEDSGQLFCFVEGPQDISFDAMIELQQRVAAIIAADPNVEAAMSFVGRVQSTFAQAAARSA